MSNRPSYKSYKEARERRQKYGPLIMGGAAIILVAVGILLIFMWTRGAQLSFGPADTATPTLTSTNTLPPPTATATETPLPSETPTPTETLVPTPSEPFDYIVQSGDNLTTIAEEFGVDYIAIMLLNSMTYESVLYVGDTITIPNPDMGVPTATPLPTGLGRGFVIEYFVLPGDSIQLIAEEFLSTTDRIIDENELEESEAIYPGQILRVPINIVTPTFGPSETPTQEATPEPSLTPTAGG